VSAGPRCHGDERGDENALRAPGQWRRRRGSVEVMSGTGALRSRRLGRPSTCMGCEPVVCSWPPLRRARVCREHGSKVSSRTGVASVSGPQPWWISGTEVGSCPPRFGRVLSPLPASSSATQLNRRECCQRFAPGSRSTSAWPSRAGASKAWSIFLSSPLTAPRTLLVECQPGVNARNVLTPSMRCVGRQ
jgi:hypothetical protein